MEGILNFAKDNYLVLLILGIFFVLALIGYFYDKYQHRDIVIEDNKTTENNAEKTATDTKSDDKK